MYPGLLSLTSLMVYLKVPASLYLIASNFTLPFSSFLTVCKTLPLSSRSWKLNASFSRVLPSSFLVTSKATSSDLAPPPIPSVVVIGAKPSKSIGWASSFVVTDTLFSTRLVTWSTGLVKRVRYRMNKPLWSRVPSPLGVIEKWFLSVTWTWALSNFVLP